MAAGKIHVRRATLDDYEAVLAINEDVYDGLDYLPTLYHQVLQSKQHVVYVAETDDRQLVGLVNYRLDPDGKTASAMSGRVREDCQQKGVTLMIYSQFHTDYPDRLYFIFDGLIQPSSQRTLDKSKCLSKWYLVRLDITNAYLQKLQAAPASSFANRPIPLTYSDSVTFATDGSCEKFLRRFSIDFIPAADGSWRPVRLCKEDLKEMIGGTSTLVTRHDQDEPKGGTIRDSKSNKDVHRAVSFSSSALLRTKSKEGSLKADICFFGEKLTDLLQHCHEHLRHLASVSGTSDAYVGLCFPLEIDGSTVEKQLATSPGIQVQFVEKAYLASAYYHDLM